MPCVHLRELYSVCQSHDLKLTSGDLIRIVCPQCGVVETCPSVYALEYDAKTEKTSAPAGQDAATAPSDPKSLP
jgi:hypothetical protein